LIGLGLQEEQKHIKLEGGLLEILTFLFNSLSRGTFSASFILARPLLKNKKESCTRWLRGLHVFSGNSQFLGAACPSQHRVGPNEVLL